MIRILNESEEIETMNNEREQQYHDYLNQHISGVQRAYDEFFKDNLLIDSNLDIEEIAQLEEDIKNHDASKYDKDYEWYQYLDNFYPISEEAKQENKDNYNLAWNHHQKENKHHWQYWVLIKDTGDIIPLPMPEPYVIQALCDWHSFAYKNPESTARHWYDNNNDKMILHDETKSIIEYYLDLYEGL